MISLLSLLFLAHPFSIDLDQTNVDSIVGQSNHLFIHFYSDGCKLCARMAPEWNNLVRMYKPISTIVLAAIDCESFPDVCETLEGISNPSVRYFAPGQKTGIAYTGVRQVGPMAEWVREMTQIEPYTTAGSVLFASPSDISAITMEGGWVFVVVDDHKTHFYNQTEILACDGYHGIQLRALSNVDYPKDAAIYCKNPSNTCIFLTNGDVTLLYDGNVVTPELTAFLDNNVSNEL